MKRQLQSVFVRKSIDDSLKTQAKSFNRNAFKNIKSNTIYHVSIIDFLQQWNFSKKLEKTSKSCLSCVRKEQSKFKGLPQSISAIPPYEYEQRFNKFILSQVLRPALEYHFSHQAQSDKDSFIMSLL